MYAIWSESRGAWYVAFGRWSPNAADAARYKSASAAQCKADKVEGDAVVTWLD